MECNCIPALAWQRIQILLGVCCSLICFVISAGVKSPPSCTGGCPGFYTWGGQEQNERWQTSVNAHGLIWATGKRSEKCPFWSNLSPLLAIPMLKIVIKHLKWSLFVRFLRGVPFLCSLSGRLLLLLNKSWRFYRCKAQHSSFVNNQILDYMSPNQWIWFSNPCWWKQNDCWLTFAKRTFPQARDLPTLLQNMFWRDSHKQNLSFR